MTIMLNCTTLVLMMTGMNWRLVKNNAKVLSSIMKALPRLLNCEVFSSYSCWASKSEIWLYLLPLNFADAKVVPTRGRVRLVNLPKKKNIDRDLKLAFQGIPGITNVVPAVIGNKKTRDPICKGFAFVDFKHEEDAVRCVLISITHEGIVCSVLYM